MKAALATVAAAMALVVAAPASAASYVDQTKLERAVAKRINKVRENRGLRPLRIVTRLSDAATGHTKVMAKYSYVAHDWWDGTPISTWIQWFYPGPGYTSWAAGENLYWSTSSPTARTVVRWWMSSPPHRRNILGKWRHLGVSAVRVKEPEREFSSYSAITVVAAEFGRRS